MWSDSGTRVLAGSLARSVPKSHRSRRRARQTSLDYSCENDWMVVIQMVATSVYLTTKPGRDTR